jgi:hypothetical protein
MSICGVSDGDADWIVLELKVLVVVTCQGLLPVASPKRDDCCPSWAVLARMSSNGRVATCENLAGLVPFGLFALAGQLRVHLGLVGKTAGDRTGLVNMAKNFHSSPCNHQRLEWSGNLSSVPVSSREEVS